jgi:pantoate--beta-alanine ligase
MRVVLTPEEMRAASAGAARDGHRVGLVPTMGALHEGHLSLVRAARAASDVVVMSVFVNPLQFGPNEDFASYPRDLARDQALAEQAGVDVLWIPPTEAMVPAPPAVTVAPGTVGSILEGAVRPGHFAGVLTVVLKLFAIVQPRVAVFGRKDAQQAALVRFMVRDFDLPVTIVVAPLVRDTDGLALSSRNAYLDAGARARALVLPRALAAGVAAFRGGERRAGSVIAAAWKVLGAEEGVMTEYLHVIDADTFLPNHAATAGSYLAAAIRIGPTRLLDNVVLGEGLEGDVRL